MFKIIAALTYLRDLTQRLTFALADVRERVVGAALSATAENLVANRAKFKDVSTQQKLAAQQAADAFDHDLKLAAEAHRKALNVICTVGNNQRNKLHAQAKALRDKHAALRALLTK